MGRKQADKGQPAKSKSTGRKVLHVLLGILLAVVVIAAVYIGYVCITYYRLPDNLELEIGMTHGECREEPAQTGQQYTIVTYNIGFGAYSPDYSFFMDGGKYSWALSEDAVYANISGAAALVEEIDPEFAFIQEIDRDSTRSYHIDESQILENYFSSYYCDFAQNYDSPFLLYPFTEPHGSSKAGLMTYSRFKIESAVRRSLPIADTFNKYLDLDRCYSISRIPVANGKELICINLHLSAYGSDASIRQGQISMLCEDMQKELDAGNYIICGGDFNHDLKNTDETADNLTSWAYPFARSALPEGVGFAFDRLTEEEIEALHNSARNADVPYEEGNYTVTLDGFIISDNIELISYECINTGFSYSDHDPVVMTFILEE